MRRSLMGFVLSGTVLLAACGEKGPHTLAPKPQAEVVTTQEYACPATDTAAIVALITDLFDSGNLNAVLSRFSNIEALMDPTPPGPETGAAQGHAIRLIGFTINKFKQGTLIGGTSHSTALQVVALVNSFLCFTGLPASFSLDDLVEDAAAAIITPESPDTTIVTGTLWAGTHVDSGSVTQPVLLTITRLPDSPGPLLTQLDQYPLFYEFSITPSGSFTLPVVVGACQASSIVPPDPTRLRLAHNVAPYTPGSIEILPIQPAPFLDCTGADIASLPSANPLFQFAREGWRTLRPVLASLFLPDPLLAFATGGVGGTTRNFSPFGAVDTLVLMTPNSPLTQRWPVGGTVPAAPSVLLKTPAGHLFSGLPVGFAVTAGGGTLTGATTTSDTNGIATVGSWTLGPNAGLNTVAATATPPHVGSGVAGSPMTFSATALPASQLAYLTQPSDLVAGTTMSPAVRVAVQDSDGHVVTSSSAPVSLAVTTAGVSLGGTTTVAAAQGIASFGDLTVTKAGTGYTLLATAGTLRSATSSAFSVFSAAAATIAAVAGDGQTAPAGTAVATPPSVLVTDAFGNPVAGVQVTFTVQNGGGSVSGAVQTTDTFGRATVDSWTIVAGANYLLATATAPNLAGNPVTFTATGTSTTSALVSCPSSSGAGDGLGYAFYWPRFAGTSLKQVDLYLSSNAQGSTPTPYTIQLIAKSGGFNGPVLGTSTVTVYLRGNASQNLLTHFEFSPVSVQRNSTVTFQFNVLSNPVGAGLWFNVGSCGLGDTKCKTSCPIVETNDATGTLSTFRRNGCGITIYGN